MKILHDIATSLPYKKSGSLKYYAANVVKQESENFSIIDHTGTDPIDISEQFSSIYVNLFIVRPGYETADILNLSIDANSKEEFTEAIETLQLIKNDFASIINVLQHQMNLIPEMKDNGDSEAIIE